LFFTLEKFLLEPFPPCTARKIPLMYSFSGNCEASVPISTIHVSVSDLYIPRIGPHISLQQNRQIDPGNTYIKFPQIYECRNWETEHYNSVLEITVSFLGYIDVNQTFI
jgi:hypothetical protein